MRVSCTSGSVVGGVDFIAVVAQPEPRGLKHTAKIRKSH